MGKKSGLGKGLSVLLPVNKESSDPTDRYEEINIDLLDPNPDQPRHYFHEGQLNELSDSIKHNGVIQPIIVTPSGKRFIVIAGERRWRATRLAGYEKIPAIVRTVEKGQMLSLALLENIQRQELNPIEEALAYRRLIDVNDYTHETLASNLGKSRVTISNTLRLLRLPDTIKNYIQDGRLSFGHARCLITVDDDHQVEKLAKVCMEKQWSVRELERRIQRERQNKKTMEPKKKNDGLKEVESLLSKTFENKVTIAGNGKKGKIVFVYNTEKEFDTLIGHFGKRSPVEK